MSSTVAPMVTETNVYGVAATIDETKNVNAPSHRENAK
eukprot:COSAG02_NODE_1269_length_13533_cov_7.935016_11_plen_38_part_00